MKSPAWKRPSPSLVLSMITLFVALTSTAGALPGSGKVERGDIAKGAVTKRSLARGAVTSKAIKARAVTKRKLANDSVIGRTLAPFSVGSAAVGDTTVVSAPLSDTDAVADNFTFSSSGQSAAACPPGSTLLGGGISIASSGNRRAFVQTSAPNGDRWLGEMATDTGGTSSGTVYAVCLL